MKFIKVRCGMLIRKTAEKLKNYWLRDQEFRKSTYEIIYFEENRIYANESTGIFSKYFLNNLTDLKIDYWDLWAFLVGFFFPKRINNEWGEFNEAGKKAGLNGRVWNILKYKLIIKNEHCPIMNEAEREAFLFGIEGKKLATAEENFLPIICAGMDFGNLKIRKELELLSKC